MADDLAIPPPPYEVSQQEFDRKTGEAQRISASQARAIEQGDDWEQWDEAAFQAAATRYQQQHGAASSSVRRPPEKRTHSDPGTGVAPLRIAKNGNNRREHRRDERAHWNDDIMSQVSSSSSASTSSSSTSASYASSSASSPGSRRDYRHGHSRSSSSTVHRTHPDDDDDHSLQPPPFTAHGPNLDGPPYDEVVLSYHGDNSSPPSPLASPRQIGNPLPNHRARESRALPRPNSPPALLSSPPAPQSRRIPQRPAPRISSNFSPPTTGVQNALGPLMEFNPQLAYSPTIKRNINQQRAPESPVSGPIDATAFYNSAVSAHLTTQTPTKPPPQPFRQSIAPSSHQRTQSSQHHPGGLAPPPPGAGRPVNPSQAHYSYPPPSGMMHNPAPGSQPGEQYPPYHNHPTSTRW